MLKFKKGTIINERFLLIECLGTGFFSQVWRAIDETLDTEVALKIFSPLTPEGMKELKREYSSTIGVSHQNLLTPQGMDVCSDGAYLVMKCCSKGSAATLAGMVDEEAVWHFVHDVADGLAYLHGLDEPIIHQDMKLANIMIDDDDRFLISDFGICYKVTQIMVRQTGRGRSAVMAYMSPERFSADYDQPLTSSDIWTLGALIYELCTGVAPFGDFGGAAQRNGQLPPKLPRGWSKELQMLCNACMQINTWSRPRASKIREFASLMLKNQHPDAAVLGIATTPHAPANDYTKNTPDILFGQLDVSSDTLSESAMIHSGADDTSLSDNSQPAYMSLGNSGTDAGRVPVTESKSRDGYESVDNADRAAHFTSGTRYRGRSERRTTHRVHHHRTPIRKAYDWFKSKSSYISFILIVSIGAGIYWYGLDNLLSLKFLPEKDKHADSVTEKVQPVSDLDAISAVMVEPDEEDSIAIPATKMVNNLPTPPPPREHIGISSIGTTGNGSPQKSTSNDDKSSGNVSGAPASATAGNTVSKPVEGTGNKPENKQGAKTKTPAPKSGDLSTAIQKGDYATIKRMADSGSAAAAGVMANKYLKENNHAAADEYARIAKKGGDPAGEEVINILKLQGYYQ